MPDPSVLMYKQPAPQSTANISKILALCETCISKFLTTLHQYYVMLLGARDGWLLPSNLAHPSFARTSVGAFFTYDVAIWVGDLLRQKDIEHHWLQTKKQRSHF